MKNLTIFLLCLLIFALSGCTKISKPAGAGKAAGYNASSKQENTTDSTEKNIYVFGNPSEKIDIDFSGYNYSMATGMYNSMMIDWQSNIGKRIRMKGRLSETKGTKIPCLSVIISDNGGCCETGFNFIDNTRKYPKDYPKLGEEIEVIGVFQLGKVYSNSMSIYLDCNQ